MDPLGQGSPSPGSPPPRLSLKTALSAPWPPAAITPVCSPAAITARKGPQTTPAPLPRTAVRPPPQDLLPSRPGPAHRHLLVGDRSAPLSHPAPYPAGHDHQHHAEKKTIPQLPCSPEASSAALPRVGLGLGAPAAGGAAGRMWAPLTSAPLPVRISVHTAGTQWHQTLSVPLNPKTQDLSHGSRVCAGTLTRTRSPAVTSSTRR